MKKFTRFFATVAAVSMVAASLAGCGSKSDNTASTDTTADSATAGDTLKIGGIGPITGGAAVYGLAVKNAAELAVKEINEAGGINGMQVEFKFEDDEHDAEKSVNAYNSLKDWGMQMLMGTVTSTPCTAVVEKTHEDNMFQLTPSGSAVESIKYDNAFRVCFSDPGQGTASAKYIGENKLASKVAVFIRNLQKRQKIRTSKLFLLKHLPKTARQTSLYSCRKQKMQVLIWYSCRSTTQKLL